MLQMLNKPRIYLKINIASQLHMWMKMVGIDKQPAKKFMRGLELHSTKLVHGRRLKVLVEKLSRVLPELIIGRKSKGPAKPHPDGRSQIARL